MVYAGFAPHLNRDCYVNINDTDPGNLLRGIMLNNLSYILQNGERNQLVELLNNGLRAHKDDIVGYRDGDRWCGLPNDIRTVTHNYRNSHAHTRRMKKEIFEEFREYMFGINDSSKPGILPRVLNYKKIVTQLSP